MSYHQPADKNSAVGVLLIAFGGPQKREDVIPFLQRVTQGRVPTERLSKVADHYDHFGGRSPVTELTFAQAEALSYELKTRREAMPVYVGMRHWHPFLADTLKQMMEAGVEQIVALILSGYESSVGWDQYQTAVVEACKEAGAHIDISYAQPPCMHPDFVDAVKKLVEQCLSENPLMADPKSTHIIFSAHSIPCSDPKADLYVEQLNQCAMAVANGLGFANWQLAYQSRSGRPQDPWLTPDITDVLHQLSTKGVNKVIVVPIGFLCDNLEVLYDLDLEAMKTAKDQGISLCRVQTVGLSKPFTNILADLVLQARRQLFEYEQPSRH